MMKRSWIFAGIGAVALAAIGIGAATIVPAASTAAASTDAAYHRPGGRAVSLRAMPVGNAAFADDRRGQLTVSLNVTGLTPGSTHTVRLIRPQGTWLTTFTNLTADDKGRATATLDSTFTGDLPPGARLQLLEGVAGPFGQHNALAATPIAEAGGLPRDPAGDRVPLQPVDITASGVNEGELRGTARITFNADLHTVTVAVDARGLTPGNHADHIHVGSCVQQGAVQVMLPDLTADATGRIHQTVTKTVTADMLNSLPATGLYLNIHQGDMNSILVNNAPALSFRPMLCGNV